MLTRQPLIIGHRGAPAYLPENTLESFRLAVEQFKVDMIELDIHATKDAVPVVIHDSRLERTTNGAGFISQWSVKDLQKLDAGYHFDPGGKKKFPCRHQGIKIPTLEEVLSAFPQSTFAIEIKEKSEAMVHAAVSLLNKYHLLERAIIGSKHHLVSRTLHKYYPDLRRFCSQHEVLALWMAFRSRKGKHARHPMMIASMPISFLGIRFDEQEWIDFLHSKEMKVWFWAFQNVKKIPALKQKGADGLVIDDPEATYQMIGREIGTAPTTS
jgi:glycerophosphoryl diester phosphodiesterase